MSRRGQAEHEQKRPSGHHPHDAPLSNPVWLLCSVDRAVVEAFVTDLMDRFSGDEYIIPE